MKIINTFLPHIKYKEMKIIHRFLLRKKYKLSWSQCGEDLIVQHIFKGLGISKPTYIDIGAYDPEYLSNTALFYKAGSQGINIEANVFLYKKFQKKRNRDITLNIGIGDTKSEMDFYIMSIPTLSTFKKKEAEKYQQEHNCNIESIAKVRVDTLSNVLNKYWGGDFPDFLSLDTEGFDLEILKSIDYEKNSPTVICVETISFSTTGNGVKNSEIILFLGKQGYLVYADTYINTIFVKKDKWIR